MWREKGYQDEALIDQYGYLDVSHEDAAVVKLVCEHGVKVGNIPKSVLGDPKKGWFLVQIQANDQILLGF